MEEFKLFILVLDATLRVSAPLVLAALAGLFSERSGVIDIGLEGKMLGAAFAAAAAGYVTGNVWIGLAAGIGVSVALALIHGYACITHAGNHIVSGMAINILVSGLTIVQRPSCMEIDPSTGVDFGGGQQETYELVAQVSGPGGSTQGVSGRQTSTINLKIPAPEVRNFADSWGAVIE